jgi:hypothetical protein
VLPLNDFERAIERINKGECYEQCKGKRFMIPERILAEKASAASFLICGHLYLFDPKPVCSVGHAHLDLEKPIYSL